jgi:peptide-methionine (S)-S-oxide reductase
MIFFTNDERQRLAKAHIAELDGQKVFSKPIITEVTPLKAFSLVVRRL